MKKHSLALKGFSLFSDDQIIEHVRASKAFEKIGVVILAGGQGSRLGFDGPKGCFELPLARKKSLFQILFEKIKAKGKNLSVAIMTSPLNHCKTLNALKEKNWFGLSPHCLDFYQQEILPMCDDEGEVFFEAPNKIAKAPAGNGKALFHLYHSPIWEKWKKTGVEYIQVLPVDNPLAEPFDGEMLACHEKEDLDLVVKAIMRTDPEEKLGILAKRDNKLIVCEYSEASEEMKSERVGDRLTYFLGNTGLFSCSMNYIERLSRHPFELPWHFAHKKGKQLVLTPGGSEIKEVWAWKFETFIFDLFPYARSWKVLLGNRKKCFAPLKNLFGQDSPETVAKAIRSKKSS